MDTLKTLIERIGDFIVDPLIAVLFAAALVIFLWGGAQFIFQADNQEQREIGARHMLWGILGIFIMIAVKGIIQIIKGTFGIP
jgi:hypothetical protein